MKVTVQEIRNMLHGLPPEMEVSFSPISSAWLGTSGPMRADNVAIYTAEGQHGEAANPLDRAVIQIVEDRAAATEQESGK